ncbi:MAG: hypothetical protein HY617_02690 [Candidatus Sungbacteria bacterium]|nr:hypothetical protein [Candidatus Sungbacteria bacterium]
MAEDTVRVAFVGRLKNAALSEFLAKKKWSQTRLAKELGVTLPVVNRWILLKGAPQDEIILRKLKELLCQLREDIFPDFFQSQEWKEMQKQVGGEHIVIREIPVQTLLNSGQLSLPSPEIEYDMKELSVKLQDALNSLPSRQKEVVELRFGLVDGIQHTLEETGKILGGLKKERVRQLELAAIRNLRLSPAHLPLFSFLDISD